MMKRNFAWLAAIWLLACAPSFAYRFLCNGVTAENENESDECGVCSDESGPRWIPSGINVLVDLETRPAEITESAWKKVVVSSLNAWNTIPGVDLRLRYAGTSALRTFGIDSGEHEIFWVMDKQEWRQKVGSGENGTLGVTVTPYQCPNSARKNREIYDADLIMNGVSPYNWKIECKESQGQCESVKGTLVHELGHFIGLGHPCPLCSWSVMSAQAGYDVDAPVLDDFDAARALYPGTLAGQMGTRCESKRDCEAGLKCISQNQDHYCSKECTASSCPNGYACDTSDGEGVCRFAIGRLAGAVGLHERCETRRCDDGLQCIETFTNKNFCVKTCTAKSECAPKEECVMFPDGGAGVCLIAAGLNQACGEFTTCDDKLVCVGKNDTEGVCKTECVSGRRNQCRSGGVCTPVGRDLSACIDNTTLPLGNNDTKDSSGTTTASGAIDGTRFDASGPWKDAPVATPAPLETGCSCRAVSAEGPGPAISFALLLGLITVGFRKKHKRSHSV